MCDIPRKDDHIVIIDLLRLHHDANLTARLNGKGLFNAREAVGNLLKLLKPFDIVFKIFASRAGSCGGNRVCCLYNEVKNRSRLHIAVMRFNCVDNLFAFLVSAGNVHADLYMGSFDFGRHRLADIMQQSGTLGHRTVDSQLLGKNAGKHRNLDGVAKHILPIAGTVLHPPEQLDQLRVQTMDAGF